MLLIYYCTKLTMVLPYVSILTINVYIGNQSAVENPKRIQRVYLLLLIGWGSTPISQVVLKDELYIYLSRLLFYT